MPWWRISPGQPRGGGWARTVAVAGCWGLGEDASCWSRLGQDAPILPLGCVISQTTWSGCQGGFPALPAGWFTFPPHTAVLKPACIFLAVAILWNPLVCSCRISFFLIPNSPCCPHQSCQCAQCPACLYSLWSSRTCSSREQPWAMVTFWCYLPVSAYITLPFFIVYSWATSVLLLLRLHSLSE